MVTLILGQQSEDIGTINLCRWNFWVKWSGKKCKNGIVYINFLYKEIFYDDIMISFGKIENVLCKEFYKEFYEYGTLNIIVNLCSIRNLICLICLCNFHLQIHRNIRLKFGFC
jgi:hypothetical protein